MRNTFRLVGIVLFALLGVHAFAGSQERETLLIGPGDTLHVQVLDTPELEQHPRVTDGGEIPLVGVGNLRVVGLTPAEAAAQIRMRFISRHFMNHPDVSVTIEQYATQTVSVLGQVKAPGAYPISTPRSVLSVVALAGGLTETADYHLTIQRRDSAQQPVSYTLSNDPRVAIAQEVQVFPGDTVVVPKAGIAYVLGDVGRPGGFVMQNNHSQLTVLQAVAMAGGTAKSAVPSHAKLIRRKPEGQYQEIAINFSAMQKGKAPDMVMEPDDVLYIPFSYLRNIAGSSSSIAASTAGAAIYARP
jgi:polysaccharide export outer membrane protein